MTKTIPVHLCAEQLDLIITHLSADYLFSKDRAEEGSSLYHDLAWVLKDLIQFKKHQNYQYNVNTGFYNDIENLLKEHNFNPEEL